VVIHIQKTPVEIRVTRTIADVGARRWNESSPVSQEGQAAQWRFTFTRPQPGLRRRGTLQRRYRMLAASSVRQVVRSCQLPVGKNLRVSRANAPLIITTDPTRSPIWIPCKPVILRRATTYGDLIGSILSLDSIYFIYRTSIIL
jgi:hypothetical protein